MPGTSNSKEPSELHRFSRSEENLPAKRRVPAAGRALAPFHSRRPGKNEKRQKTKSSSVAGAGLKLERFRVQLHSPFTRIT